MQQKERVFVYGTLRRGECNHGLLKEAVFLGQCQTQPVYALYDLGEYPGVTEGRQAICGEVYAVTPAQLLLLDELEDIPVEYRREMTDTSFGTAWIYLYQDNSKLQKLILSGDWCNQK